MKKTIFLKIILIFVFGLLTVNITNAQVYSNQPVGDTVTGENAFLDASSTFSNAVTFENSNGKGLVFPTTDLTQFLFNTTLMNNSGGSYFGTGFDGMIIYNVGTGLTSNIAGQPTVASSVVPGFYYFSNPGASSDISAGVWLPLGAASAKYNITSTAVATNAQIDGATVWAKKGTFSYAVDPTTAVINIGNFLNTGTARLVRADIYNDATGGIVSSFSSINRTTGDAVIGFGRFSELLPIGSYHYVIEYLP